MGDDLGDDFNFLDSKVREDAVSSDDDSSIGRLEKKKRLRDESNDGDSMPKKKTPANLLIAAGKRIEDQSPKDQATFLSIMVRHHRLLADSTSDQSQDAFSPEFFVPERKETSVDSITTVIPQNKLRKWKERMSPAVIIVTISARRAVALLKDLSDLKVRAAKLFPKTGTVKAQIIHLRKHPCPIAVGTPQRINALLEDNMSLDKTRLIILDAHVSQKDFTVCTLPDTATHVASLLNEYALPQLTKRDDIKLAFF